MINNAIIERWLAFEMTEKELMQAIKNYKVVTKCNNDCVFNPKQNTVIRQPKSKE